MAGRIKPETGQNLNFILNDLVCKQVNITRKMGTELANF